MDDDADLISRLPHDLLISILSRLTLKEAMATSVLSRRWEKLWTFYHGNLDFEVSRTLRKKGGCSNYARVVNRVLDTLEGGGVFDSFTIPFGLCSNVFSSVDRWVQFAFEKRKVKRLDFNPYALFSSCWHAQVTYDFPPLRPFFAQQCYIQALTSIRFWCVNVSGETIQHLLSNCPLLQSLEFQQLGRSLIHLRVFGEALPLRHLAIRLCHYLNTIEISAPNLVSLQYTCIQNTCVKFDVLNVPKLLEFTIGVNKIPLTPSGRHPLSCFSYIQKLELQISSEVPDDYMNLNELSSVKHLTMVAEGPICGHILAWTPLLKTFPGLQKLTLDMECRLEHGIHKAAGDNNKIPNKCLEVFEFIGFDESNGVIKLVEYFLKNIVPLEKIIVECENNRYAMSFTKKYKEKVKDNAMKLKRIIPKEVNLVIVT